MLKTLNICFTFWFYSSVLRENNRLKSTIRGTNFISIWESFWSVSFYLWYSNSIYEKCIVIDFSDYLSKKKIEDNVERIAKFDDLIQYIPRETEKFKFKSFSETEMSKYLVI